MGSTDFAVEALAAALVELDTTLADNLLIAVRTFIVAERHLIAIDKKAGQDVTHRSVRVAQLETFIAKLEAELLP
jgi:hypothetical protein